MPNPFIKLICSSPIILGICGEYDSLTQKPLLAPAPGCESIIIPTHQKLKPLADLLAQAEGNYDSVNRGYAGDTPGGIQSLTGKQFKDFTVGQVADMQASSIYAVGRYQLIPATLKFAVNASNVRFSDKFTTDVQDRLMAALVFHKRPSIGAYLAGKHDNVEKAVTAVSMEWASVEYRNGRGFYDHFSGNRASISRDQVKYTLMNIKNDWNPSYSGNKTSNGLSL
jgi:hypothetical protein